MKKDDVIIWYRVYLMNGDSVDVMKRPLIARSYRDWADEFQEELDELNFADYEIVDYDYIDESSAYGIFLKEDVWEAWNDFFDISGEYGIPSDVLVKLMKYGWDVEQLKDVIENSYEGKYDYPSMRNLAYHIVEEKMLNPDHYEWYFDYGSFGRELQWDYSVEMFVEEYGSAVSEAEDMMDMSDEDIAEWYIESIGDLKELGQETLETYFDYQKLERTLEAEGYLEIDGHIFRPY